MQQLPKKEELNCTGNLEHNELVDTVLASLHQPTARSLEPKPFAALNPESTQRNITTTSTLLTATRAAGESPLKQQWRVQQASLPVPRSRSPLKQLWREDQLATTPPALMRSPVCVVAQGSSRYTETVSAVPDSVTALFERGLLSEEVCVSSTSWRLQADGCVQGVLEADKWF